MRQRNAIVVVMNYSAGKEQWVITTADGKEDLQGLGSARSGDTRQIVRVVCTSVPMHDQCGEEDNGINMGANGVWEDGGRNRVEMGWKVVDRDAGKSQVISPRDGVGSQKQ